MQALRDGAVLARRRQPECVVRLKEDGSIQTDADRDVETLVRQRLAENYPGTSVWGEEFGFSEPGPDGIWVLDPIDGTSNYAFGMPLWAVTAALVRQGTIVWGAMILPELGWEFRATKGQGATLNGRPLEPLPAGPLQAHELVGVGESLPTLELPAGRVPGKIRHFGSIVVECAFMATGGLRALLTARVQLYDCAGGFAVLREMGAEIRTLEGRLWNEADYIRPNPSPAMAVVPPGSGFPFAKIVE